MVDKKVLLGFCTSVVHLNIYSYFKHYNNNLRHILMIPITKTLFSWKKFLGLVITSNICTYI